MVAGTLQLPGLAAGPAVENAAWRPQASSPPTLLATTRAEIARPRYLDGGSAQPDPSVAMRKQLGLNVQSRIGSATRFGFRLRVHLRRHLEKVFQDPSGTIAKRQGCDARRSGVGPYPKLTAGREAASASR